MPLFALANAGARARSSRTISHWCPTPRYSSGTVRLNQLILLGGCPGAGSVTVAALMRRRRT